MNLKKTLKNHLHALKSCITEDQIEVFLLKSSDFLKTLNLSGVPVRQCADLCGKKSCRGFKRIQGVDCVSCFGYIKTKKKGTVCSNGYQHEDTKTPSDLAA